MRVFAGPHYCSGVLIAPDLRPATDRSRLVLTCAHFWRDLGVHQARVTGAARTRIAAVRAIDGTDLAVALLAGPSPAADLPGLARQIPGPGERLTTHGFGGQARAPEQRVGRVLLPVPWSASKDWRTRVRPAILVHNSPAAVKGDSGGPVFARGELAGVQSLILDPLGHVSGVATVAPVAPHLGALRAACRDFLGRM